MLTMAYLEKFLYLKKSKLPKAGKGLFTHVDIPKGTRICEYKGRLQPWKDVREEDENGTNHYIFRLSPRLAVNAINYKKTFGRYANDAMGFSRVNGLRNNADYETKGNRVYIDARRAIKKNEEIFVEYGGNFWALLRRVERRKK